MARYQPRGPFLSVNAKQLARSALQADPSRCESGHGCQSCFNASCPRSSVRSERHRAKVEVAGAIPAVDAILPLCLSSHRTSFVNSYSSVRVRPEAPAFACPLRLGRPFYGDHDVTAASRPVTASVRVQISLANSISTTASNPRKEVTMKTQSSRRVRRFQIQIGT